MKKFILLFLNIVFLFSCASDVKGSVETPFYSNLLSNNQFESNLDSWSVVGDSSAAVIQDNGITGKRLTHYSDKEFSVETNQLITGLTNGIYRLSVYSVGGSAEESYIFAQDFGGESIKRNISEADWGDWTEFTIENIMVNNGQCRVGFYTRNSEWTSFDNITLERVESIDNNNEVIGGNPVDIISQHGFNYGRVRLLVDPPGNYGLHQDLDYVIEVAKDLKSNNMKILLDLFYSNWWCDPAHNYLPDSWPSDLGLLEDKVYNYTVEVLERMSQEGVSPDMVQVGNEVNGGMLWPIGRLSGSWSDYITLSNAGYRGVKSFSEEIPVLIQYAGGGSGAINWYRSFINNGGELDLIGISFYEMWHGDINSVTNTLESLSSFGKDLYIVETAAYWKDSEANYNTSYSHTKEGQYDFLYDLTVATKDIPRVKGLFYWGTTWTQAHKWLDAPDWGNDDAGCRGLFDDDAKINPAVDAILDAGGFEVIGADVSEYLYMMEKGVIFQDDLQ